MTRTRGNKPSRVVKRTQKAGDFSDDKREQLYQRFKAGGFTEEIKSAPLAEFVQQRREKDERVGEQTMVEEEVVENEVVEDEVVEDEVVEEEEQTQPAEQTAAVENEPILIEDDEVVVDTAKDEATSLPPKRPSCGEHFVSMPHWMVLRPGDDMQATVNANLTVAERNDSKALYIHLLRVCITFRILWSPVLRYNRVERAVRYSSLDHLLSTLHTCSYDSDAALGRLNMGPELFTGSLIEIAQRVWGPEYDEETGRRIRKICLVICRESGEGVFGPQEELRRNYENLILALRYIAANPGYDGILLSTRLERRATDAIPRGGGQTAQDIRLNQGVDDLRNQFPGDIIQIDAIIRGPDGFASTAVAWNKWVQHWSGHPWNYRFNIFIYQRAPDPHIAAHPFFVNDMAWSVPMAGWFSIAPIPASPVQQNATADRLFDLAYDIAQNKMDNMQAINTGRNLII